VQRMRILRLHSWIASSFYSSHPYQRVPYRCFYE